MTIWFSMEGIEQKLSTLVCMENQRIITIVIRYMFNRIGKVDWRGFSENPSDSRILLLWHETSYFNTLVLYLYVKIDWLPSIVDLISNQSWRTLFFVIALKCWIMLGFHSLFTPNAFYTVYTIHASLLVLHSCQCKKKIIKNWWIYTNCFNVRWCECIILCINNISFKCL